MARETADLQSIVPPEFHSGLAVLLEQSADRAFAIGRLRALHAAHPAEFQQILYAPFGMQALVTVFSCSRFLAREVEDHPQWLLEILSSGSLHRARLREEFDAELEAWLGGVDEVPEPLRLAAFRRKQILRIMLRDTLGFGGLAEITEELSLLAEAVLDAVYARLRRRLERQHGAPPPGAPWGMTILAAGKLGGRELNYSSDIDLIFLHTGDGTTAGPEPLTAAEFFRRLSLEITRLLGQTTAEGLIYRIDLRLRPEGRHGALCPSLEAARRYYETRARDWELQMLIKVRPAAGDLRPGQELLEALQPRIYSTSLDFRAIDQMAETREKIDRKLLGRRRAAGIDVKLAPGGIRDIEFLVQCLQRLYGGRESWLRNASTLQALMRLRDKDLLSGAECACLASAYQFLRTLEHRLQLEEDRQTHWLPADAETLERMARRMPADLVGEPPSGEALWRQLNAHLTAVRALYDRIVVAHQAPPPPAPEPAAPPAVEERVAAPRESNLLRYLDQRAPRFAMALRRTALGASAAAFDHFLERVIADEERLAELEASRTLVSHLLDLASSSPYFTEQLARQPDLLEELAALGREEAPEARFAEEFESLRDAAAVRRHFRRRMFQLQAESVCLRWPVFPTLQKVSVLADAAVAACARLAAAAAGFGHCQLMAVALGRLGMMEFDLGSDADLVFILPDELSAELPRWTRVAESIVAMLASYTSDGTLFSVDTRLAPEGRSGPLVQTEAACREYFRARAEAWEGLAWMKARAVAGPVERATALLEELQQIDWRRYGQSARSRTELREMRLRLERELGAEQPLKAGPGGWYDIDFALTWLRLRGAGLFFRVLNTPARIAVLEQMGHLDSAEARFLLDASTFYRALDHALRIITGQAPAALPRSPRQTRLVESLLRRWAPPHLCDQPLEEELAQIRTRTRDFFDELFSKVSA
ncbi:MAG: glutamine-synthetase adenylyltransferase [Bryobacteraceae bacterium]|nr:glutamine-synthetase adenylyltransferase [Bryobacteraceae bacterium]